MKSPEIFPLHVADFLLSQSVRQMDATQAGAYLLLLLESWVSRDPGYLPASDADLRQLARLTPEQWQEHKAAILANFEQNGGRVYNRRLRHELEISEAETNTIIYKKAREEGLRRKNELISEVSRKVLEGWNAIPGVVGARRFSHKRLSALKARLKDQFWVENWEAALKKVPDCPWLLGAGDRGWVATLDWFLRPDSVQRILEGVYDKAEGPQQLWLSEEANG